MNDHRHLPTDLVDDAREEGQRVFKAAVSQIDRKQRRSGPGRAQVAAAKAAALAAEYTRLLGWLDVLNLCDELSAS